MLEKKTHIFIKQKSMQPSSGNLLLDKRYEHSMLGHNNIGGENTLKWITEGNLTSKIC